MINSLGVIQGRTGSWWDRLAPALVAAAAFLLLFLGMDRAADLFDEGIVLSAAMRLLEGAVVHRDFYSVYGPGSYAAVAGVFALFGPSFMAARLFGLSVMAGIVGLSFAVPVEISDWADRPTARSRCAAVVLVVR